MKFDPNANHPLWTRETDDVFKNVIRQAQIDGLSDEHGRVDVGLVVHGLVYAYSEGRVVIVPPKNATIKDVLEKPIEEKPSKPKRSSKAKTPGKVVEELNNESVEEDVSKQ